MPNLIPGVSIELGDGNTYVFPPLALASLEALQDELKGYGAGGVADTKSIYRVALHSLNRNYPGMTRKMLTGVFHEDAESGAIIWDVPALLDLGNMKAVMEAVMDVSGVVRSAQAEAGKAAAANP